MSWCAEPDIVCLTIEDVCKINSKFRENRLKLIELEIKLNNIDKTLESLSSKVNVIDEDIDMLEISLNELCFKMSVLTNNSMEQNYRINELEKKIYQ